MSDHQGSRPNRKGRRGRAILSVKTAAQPPKNCSRLASVKPFQLTENQPQEQAPSSLEQQLYAERNAWDIGRRSLPQQAEDWLRGRGFAGRGKLSLQDADRLWDEAKMALAEGGAE